MSAKYHKRDSIDLKRCRLRPVKLIKGLLNELRNR